jgi:hypothetical protein
VLERLGEVAGETGPEKLPPFAELTRWETFAAEERHRLLQAWIERVDYDGRHGRASITFLSSSPKQPSKRRQKLGVLGLSVFVDSDVLAP